MTTETVHQQDFEHIFTLIKEAQNRAYKKANSELVLLYFHIGQIVSEKVDSGTWGDKTVIQLAEYIQLKASNLTGFTRRGLYRMKQFYELYNAESAVFNLWKDTVSPTATILKK